MTDPLIQQALELFDGVVTSIERTEYAERRLAGTPETAPAEPTAAEDDSPPPMDEPSDED